MNKFQYFSVLVMTAAASQASVADGSLSSGIDCTETDIQYIDDPNLTRAERIALMEKAFFESLNRFEYCYTSNSSQSSSQSGGASGASGNGDNAGGDSELIGDAEEVASVASSGIEGTELETEEFDNDPESVEYTETRSAGLANGAIPEDIPDVDNDDAIAAQIRLAAELEQDPEKKEKLWDEYRKYKGIKKK